MQKVNEMPFSRLKNRICGLWYDSDISNDRLSTEQIAMLKNKTVAVIKSKIDMSIKSFAIPFLDKNKIVPLEIVKEMQPEYYLGITGIFPYDSFVDSQPEADRHFWYTAYKALDLCFSVEQEPCKNNTEMYDRCVKGLLAASKNLVVIYGKVPNQQTFDLICEAGKHTFCDVQIISLADI